MTEPPTELINELALTYHRLDREGEIEFPDLITVTLAQWLLESARGTSELATRYFNFGGLKWRSEMAAGAGGDDRGAARPVLYDAHDGRDDYCRFSDPENFIFGYWRFIGRSPYRGYERFGSDPEGYIQFLKERGYAADPRYVSKVLSLLTDAQDLLKKVSGGAGGTGTRGGERDDRRGGRRRRPQRTPERRDAVYLHNGPSGFVEEWEGGELIADTETQGDVDSLLDFLDATAVMDYALIEGADARPDRTRRSRRTRRAPERADGVYIDDSPAGRVEEWENGELLAETETNGDVDRLLDFLDQTLVQDYFLLLSERRRRRGRVGDRLQSGRSEDGGTARPLQPMDGNDERDRIKGVLEGLDVALDVGHGITAKGVKDPGAVNKLEGIEEHDLNLLVARTAAEILRERGATVDVFHYTDPLERLTLRQKGKRAEGRDVFVSCHHNAASSTSAQRTETLLGEGHNTTEDLRLATAIQGALVSALNLRDGGVKKRPLGVLAGAGSLVKAKCLIEPYFISERSITKAKAQALSLDAGEALARGIEDYWLAT
jgi:N-acetylmuramoyl-L-alanine amidase